MSATDYKIKVAIQIQRPASQVYRAIIDPEDMKNYFISWGSARMDSAQEVYWEFPEFEGRFPVRIIELVADRSVIFSWDIDGVAYKVNITLEPVEEDITVVRITEESLDTGITNIQWLKSNTEGWANFLACIKAYLEFGINLRKGAFDYMKAR